MWEDILNIQYNIIFYTSYWVKIMVKIRKKYLHEKLDPYFTKYF